MYNIIIHYDFTINWISLISIVNKFIVVPIILLKSIKYFNNKKKNWKMFNNFIYFKLRGRMTLKTSVGKF